MYVATLELVETDSATHPLQVGVPYEITFRSPPIVGENWVVVPEGLEDLVLGVIRGQPEQDKGDAFTFTTTLSTFELTNRSFDGPLFFTGDET